MNFSTNQSFDKMYFSDTSGQIHKHNAFIVATKLFYSKDKSHITSGISYSERNNSEIRCIVSIQNLISRSSLPATKGNNDSFISGKSSKLLLKEFSV